MKTAEKIKIICEERDIPIKSLAIDIDVPYSTLRDYIFGVSKNIPFDVVVKICNKLDISVEAVIDDEIKKEPSKDSSMNEDLKSFIDIAKKMNNDEIQAWLAVLRQRLQ